MRSKFCLEFSGACSCQPGALQHLPPPAYIPIHTAGPARPTCSSRLGSGGVEMDERSLGPQYFQRSQRLRTGPATSAQGARASTQIRESTYTGSPGTGGQLYSTALFCLAAFAATDARCSVGSHPHRPCLRAQLRPPRARIAELYILHCLHTVPDCQSSTTCVRTAELHLE